MDSSGTWRGGDGPTPVQDIQYTNDSFCIDLGPEIQRTEGNIRPLRYNRFGVAAEFLGNSFFLTADGVARPYGRFARDENYDDYWPLHIYPGTHGAVEAAGRWEEIVCARGANGSVHCNSDIAHPDTADQIASGAGICFLTEGSILCDTLEGQFKVPMPGDAARLSIFGAGDSDGKCDNAADAAELRVNAATVFTDELLECVKACDGALDPGACMDACPVPAVSADCLSCVEEGALCMATAGAGSGGCLASFSECSGQPRAE